VLPLIDDLKLLINKNSLINEEQLEKKLFNIKEFLIMLDTNLMDKYLLGRLFKYTDSKYVIIYAGDDHIQKYVEFFEYTPDKKRY